MVQRKALDLKVLSPNIGWGISYPKALCGFPQSQEENIDYARTTSFQVLYNKLFTTHQTVEGTKGSQNIGHKRK
jgi:hypothetical protein